MLHIQLDLVRGPRLSRAAAAAVVVTAIPGPAPK